MADTVIYYKGKPIADLTKDELVDALTWAFQEIAHQRKRADRYLQAAAALAEPEPKGPTDEELEEEFGRALLKLPGDSMNATAVTFARAVLARWGNHPGSPDSSTPQPAAGEVAELVELIRQSIASAWEPAALMLGNMTAAELSRVAELLEQLNPPPTNL